MNRRGVAGMVGRWSIRRALAAAVAVLFFPFAAGAQGVGTQLLPGHVPPAIARFRLQPTGLLPATNRLHLAIGLPMRNQAALDQLLAQIYDPAGTNYHHYLTPAQIAGRFGSPQQDYQALIAFVKTNGLTVTTTYPNRLLLDVSGSVATVEKVFHVTLRTYHDPVENRPFFAPDTDPSIDFSIPLLHVAGLDNYAVPHPASLKKNLLNNKPGNVVTANGSGPGGAYMGNDFRAAYASGVTLTGAGQMVGLLEFDGFYSNDITTYETQAGIPPISIITNLIDFNGAPSGNQNTVGEVSLDIEMAISMATNLAAVVVYEAGSGADFDDMLMSMAASNQIKQFSSSWGLTGGSTDPNADQTFTNMALEGQSFFQASGDGDAWVNTIWVPAASPYITSVGGTELTMTGSGASYASETVWNSGNLGAENAWGPNGDGYWGSGGGVSTAYSIPSWQTNINMTTNQGSTTMRNIPDVALTADNIYVVYFNGDNGPFGGTSCAAPLWAGFMALVNQQAALTFQPPVGFFNPALYALGQGPNYTLDFHDITDGNNFSAVSPTNYPAVPGYDLCTGWGTPNGQNLINALAPPDTLIILPANGFAAAGPPGGPFSPDSEILALTNTGATSLTWSLINTSAWLNASSTGGILTVGGADQITLSLTAAANELGVGDYAATVELTNGTTHIAQALQFGLQVLQPLVIAPSSGFVASGLLGGPFSPNAETFQLTNTGAASLNWSLINTSAWLTVSGGGALAAGATDTATVSLSPNAANLAAGLYNAGIWFTNQTQGGALNCQFTLLVSASLVQNGGFETGDFTDWTLYGDGGAYNYVTTGVIGMTPHSGNYFAALGQAYFQAYLSQAIPTSAGQAYLLSLWLNSPDGETPNEFSVTWNANTLFDQLDLPQSDGWTNLQFVVTGTGADIILQIGARDDPSWLGLDDVSLTPIPAAVFEPTQTTETNNDIMFTWNALTGLLYQVQFKTNLLQTNWAVLQTITATNTSATFVDTNPITGSPQKFYRLQVLP